MTHVERAEAIANHVYPPDNDAAEDAVPPEPFVELFGLLLAHFRAIEIETLRRVGRDTEPEIEPLEVPRA